MSVKFEQVPIEEADADQLRQFARNNLGMDFHHNKQIAGMLAEIKKAWINPHIMVAIEDDEEALADAMSGTPPPEPENFDRGEAVRPLPQGTSRDDPLVRLTLHETSEGGAMGKQPVPISVNGSTMLIPRGVEVEIPYRYFLALGYAVRTHYDQDAEGNINAADVPAYPFSVHLLPTREQLEWWHARDEMSEAEKTAFLQKEQAAAQQAAQT